MELTSSGVVYTDNDIYPDVDTALLCHFGSRDRVHVGKVNVAFKVVDPEVLPCYFFPLLNFVFVLESREWVKDFGGYFLLRARFTLGLLEKGGEHYYTAKV